MGRWCWFPDRACMYEGSRVLLALIVGCLDKFVTGELV